MPKDSKQKILVLIDGHALVHRAYHALPPLNSNKGELVNAVYGFTLILLRILRELKPDYIAAAFDLPAPTFRHKEFTDYQAHRVKAPDELYNQIKRVQDVLRAFNIPFFEKEGFEADDLIGTIAQNAQKKARVIIATGDMDTLQLVNENVSVFTLKKGVKETIVYDKKAVRERFGLEPSQMTDYKGLKGDPSDNIPGVPGVGDKTACELLKKYGSIEAIYRDLEKPKKGKGKSKVMEKLAAAKEQAFFSKYLATIKTDVPLKFDLKDALVHDFKKEEVARLFKDLGFYSLVEKIPEYHEGSSEAEEKIIESVGVLEKIEQAYMSGVLSKDIYELEKKLAPVIAQMEKNGILIDCEYLKNLGVNVGQKIGELENKIHESAGLNFNINSPQQLSEVLFNKLNIATRGLKKTPGKVISTAAPELIKLKDQHKIIPLILEYRELAKLKSTYIDALPELVGPDGRLHTSFDQLGTSTGRLSSKNPNLQNIPIKTELCRQIRRAFLADKGSRLLAADYSQIELRVVAALSGDKNMIAAFKGDKDIHNITAAEIFGVEPEKVDAKMRRMAKVLNFGVIYGMSVHGFSEAAEIDREGAKDFIKKYFEEFSGVAQFIERTKKEAADRGYVQTLFGRKRFIPEINSSAWNLRQAAERMAINMPVQGTAADLLKMAMVQIEQDAWLKQNTKMLLQVHDELIFEVPEAKIEEAAKKIKDIMENIYELEVPLKVDIEIGDNWGELVHLDI